MTLYVLVHRKYLYLVRSNKITFNFHMQYSLYKKSENEPHKIFKRNLIKFKMDTLLEDTDKMIK